MPPGLFSTSGLPSTPTLALFSLLGLTAACSAIPDAHQPQNLRESVASFAPATPQQPMAADQTFAPQAGRCLADLGARQVAFTPLPDQYYGAGCSRVNSVRLMALTSDNAALGVTHLGAVTCPLANSFAGWARFGVDRAARQILGSPIVQIETMGSYNCRNIAGTDKRSAHSTGNAIDVSGFVLADGRRITLLGNWYAGTPAERQFLRVIHQSACRRFGTVLGPEFNPAHHNHFHVELSSHGICH